MLCEISTAIDRREGTNSITVTFREDELRRGLLIYMSPRVREEYLWLEVVVGFE